MRPLLADPVILAVVLPFLASLLGCGLLRAAGRDRPLALAAGAGTAFGFLLADLLIAGWPQLPPVNATQKLPWLVMLGAAAGGMIDTIGAPRAAVWPVVLVWPVLVVGWIGQGRLVGHLSQGDPLSMPLIGLLLLVLAGGIVLGRMARIRSRAADPSTLLAVTGLGLGLLAIDAHASQLSLLSFAIAASLAAHLVINWPRPRLSLGMSGVLAMGGALLAIGVELSLYALDPVGLVAIALVVMCAFADHPLREATLGEGAVMTALRPLILAVTGIIPVLIAMALALLAV